MDFDFRKIQAKLGIFEFWLPFQMDIFTVASTYMKKIADLQ